MSAPRMNIFLIFIAIAAAVFGTGCGQSGDTKPALTKAEFIQRAEKLCVKAETEAFEEAGAYARQHPASKEEDLVLPVLIPALRREADGLRRLPPPAEGESEVQAILEALEEGIEHARENPSSAVSSDANPFELSNELAAKYGAKDCARNP